LPAHENYYHYISDSFMLLLQTLIETGLLPRVISK
jgi:hypothetical protein